MYGSHDSARGSGCYTLEGGGRMYGSVEGCGTRKKRLWAIRFSEVYGVEIGHPDPKDGHVSYILFTRHIKHSGIYACELIADLSTRMIGNSYFRLSATTTTVGFQLSKKKSIRGYVFSLGTQEKVSCFCIAKVGQTIQVLQYIEPGH
jgi:hypothetical protein